MLRPSSHRVYLASVEGDQEGFSDVIGQAGVLRIPASNVAFAEFKTEYDSIDLLTKRVTQNIGTIRVSTAFGNVFTFKILPGVAK